MTEDDLLQMLAEKDKEIERLNNIINDLNKIVEKIGYCAIVDNPRKEFVKVLKRR